MKKGVIYFNKIKEENNTIFYALCFITQGKGREIKITIAEKDKYDENAIKKRVKGLMEDWWMCQKASNPHGACFNHPKVNLEIIENNKICLKKPSIRATYALPSLAAV